MARRVLILTAALALSLFAASACGNKAEPTTPSLSDPAHAAVDPTNPAASTALPAASADPHGAGGDGEASHHRQRKPFAIHSSCARIVTIVFGEDPKAPNAGRRTIAPDSTIDGPRDSEGKATVWILDEKGEPLPLKPAQITRGMKQLDIGRSCTTYDAH